MITDDFSRSPSIQSTIQTTGKTYAYPDQQIFYLYGTQGIFAFKNSAGSKSFSSYTAILQCLSSLSSSFSQEANIAAIASKYCSVVVFASSSSSSSCTVPTGQSEQHVGSMI